jgi:Flp pilus assembly pilin Flp
MLRTYLNDLLGGEEGISGMEYAVVAAIVIVAVGAALRLGTPTISTIVTSAMTAVQGALTG